MKYLNTLRIQGLVVLKKKKGELSLKSLLFDFLIRFLGGNRVEVRRLLRVKTKRMKCRFNRPLFRNIFPSLFTPLLPSLCTVWSSKPQKSEKVMDEIKFVVFSSNDVIEDRRLF